jgi:DedD protein
VATGVREHEEKSHSARILVLIFLLCSAVCGVFFSMGFVVGRNERSLQSGPPVEVVTSPPVIPPTVNPPLENTAAAPQDSAGGNAPLTPAVGTEVVAPREGGTNSATPASKPGDGAPPLQQAQASPKPTAGTASPPSPAADEVGVGITLQVVALRTKQDAENLVNILKTRGYPVFLVTPEYAHADDNLFRVLVGPFKTHEDADKMRAKLVQDGFKPFIRH